MHEMRNDRLCHAPCIDNYSLATESGCWFGKSLMRMAHAKEAIMLAPLTLKPISLAARSVHRIENAKGIRVSCVRGVAWITQERDPRDLILAAGQSVVLDQPGLAVAYA